MIRAFDVAYFMISADTLEDNSILLSIKAGTNNNDGGTETLGIRINGVPAGASLSVGVRDPLTGAWALRPDQLENVRLIVEGSIGERREGVSDRTVQVSSFTVRLATAFWPFTPPFLPSVIARELGR